MINGAHIIINSQDAEADRAFLKDVIGFPYVDDGGGWLIFALPPSEVAFHPAARNDEHEFYLLCDDIAAFCEQMTQKKVSISEPHEEPWGTIVEVDLPGGGKLGVYEPKHARPPESQ